MNWGPDHFAYIMRMSILIKAHIKRDPLYISIFYENDYFLILVNDFLNILNLTKKKKKNSVTLLYYVHDLEFYNLILFIQNIA